MDQRFQQAQLKLPQAQVSAVSHNPGKINYQFFFFFLLTVEKGSYQA